MWIFIIVVVAIFALGAIMRLPQFKGWTGELQTNIAARIWLRRPDYRRIKNVTIPKQDGGTTQIDHIIVSPFGIFVVETKNMRGWIFGKEGEKTWTQKFPQQSFQFPNPLRQNYAHTKTLSEVLGLPQDKFKSVVVFVGDAEFRKRMPENVTMRRGYVDYIRKHTERILTEDQIDAALTTIAQKRLAPGWKTHRDHVRHLKKKNESR